MLAWAQSRRGLRAGRSAAGIDKINIIEMSNGSGSGGVGKMINTVGGGMTAMRAMLNDRVGIDIARLEQAKAEAAAEEAARKLGQH